MKSFRLILLTIVTIFSSAMATAGNESVGVMERLFADNINVIGYRKRIPWFSSPIYEAELLNQATDAYIIKTYNDYSTSELFFNVSRIITDLKSDKPKFFNSREKDTFDYIVAHGLIFELHLVQLIDSRGNLASTYVLQVAPPIGMRSIVEASNLSFNLNDKMVAVNTMRRLLQKANEHFGLSAIQAFRSRCDAALEKP